MNRRHAMKKLCVLLITLLIILNNSCSQKPEEAILGKWETEKKDVILLFMSDGTYTSTITFPSKHKNEFICDYKLIDGKHLKMGDNCREIGKLTSEEELKYRRGKTVILEVVSISKNELILKSPDGETAKFNKIK
jgi:alpha-L-fucosidase